MITNLIEPPVLIAFAMTAFAIVLTPGPDTMLLLHRSITGGLKYGIAAVGGIQFGLLLHTILALVGLSVLINSSVILFKITAIAGAFYLAWLAIQNLKSVRVKKITKVDSTMTLRKTFLDAMFCNVLNPKVILLYVGLLPNFINIERGAVTLQLMLLGALLILINLLWQLPLAVLANSAKNILSNPMAKRLIDGVSGLVLLFFAVMMIYVNVIKS